MILLPDARSLAPAEQFGLRCLVDLARLIPVTGTAVPAVRLELSEAAPSRASVVDEIVAAHAVAGPDGTVSIPRALLGAVAAIVSADAEQRSDTFDAKGRVVSAANALVAADCAREPIVSHAAARLRESVAAVAAASGRPFAALAPWPAGHDWAALLTHDLDVVDWWLLPPILRAAELARAGRWGLLGRMVREFVRQVRHDPVTAGVRMLHDAEAAHDIPATWFIITEDPTFASRAAGDVTYRPDSPKMRALLGAIGRAGHAVGLHGSFATTTDADRLRRQRARLATLSGGKVPGVRQHFLRMRPGATQRAMSAAGFEYDATFGFFDRGGFRLGVADVVPAWSAETAAELPLDLVPLIWMDRTLSKYAGVQDPQAWVDDALALAGACRETDGAWCGLWHPNVTDALGFPGADAAWRRLVSELAAHRPWWATADELVRWRRLRRSLVANGVTDRGVPLLEGATLADTEVAVQLPGGRTAPAAVRPSRDALRTAHA